MQSIDFYKLTRAVQERFIGSVNGTGLPAPILRSNAPPRAPLVWLGVSAAALLTALLFFRLGFGDLTSGLAVQRLPWLFAYVALIALAVFGLVSTLAILREYKKSPFRRGVYVFPVGLIDARSPVLRVYPIEDLADVADPVGNRFTLRFGRAAFGFPVKGTSQAETASRQRSQARAAKSKTRTRRATASARKLSRRSIRSRDSRTLSSPPSQSPAARRPG